MCLMLGHPSVGLGFINFSYVLLLRLHFAHPARLMSLCLWEKLLRSVKIFSLQSSAPTIDVLSMEIFVGLCKDP